MLNRLTRSWVLRLSRLEEVKDVLRARCRPKSEEPVIRIGEGPTAADRHEARVSDLGEDHGRHSFLYPPNTKGGVRVTRRAPKQSLQTRWSIRKLVNYTEVIRGNGVNDGHGWHP